MYGHLIKGLFSSHIRGSKGELNRWLDEEIGIIKRGLEEHDVSSIWRGGTLQLICETNKQEYGDQSS